MNFNCSRAIQQKNWTKVCKMWVCSTFFDEHPNMFTVCNIAVWTTSIGSRFYFDAVKVLYPLQRKYQLFFCTNKNRCLLLEIHLYIFRKPFTQWNGDLQLFSSFLLSMSSSDSDYQRLFSVSGMAPEGPTELVLCWHSISLWGLGTIPSTFFFPFF